MFQVDDKDEVSAWRVFSRPAPCLLPHFPPTASFRASKSLQQTCAVHAYIRQTAEDECCGSTLYTDLPVSALTLLVGQQEGRPGNWSVETWSNPESSSFLGSWAHPRPYPKFQTAYRSVQPILQGSRSWETDMQTDRPRYLVCSNRPHIASAAMWPKMKANWTKLSLCSDNGENSLTWHCCLCVYWIRCTHHSVMCMLLYACGGVLLSKLPRSIPCTRHPPTWPLLTFLLSSVLKCIWKIPVLVRRTYDVFQTAAGDRVPCAMCIDLPIRRIYRL